jgi:hypothetical protein
MLIEIGGLHTIIAAVNREKVGRRPFKRFAKTSRKSRPPLSTMHRIKPLHLAGQRQSLVPVLSVTVARVPRKD